jgi:hypothetical protein
MRKHFTIAGREIVIVTPQIQCFKKDQITDYNGKNPPFPGTSNSKKQHLRQGQQFTSNVKWICETGVFKLKAKDQ